MTYEELEAENKKLKEMLVQQERGAKLLVRRDLELSEANERLNQLDKEKSEFVSIAAHQLRTPISAIKWAIDMLIEGHFGELNEEQHSILKRAFESNEHVVNLIGDLLNVDRIESGREKLVFAQLDIWDLLSEEVKEASLPALESGVRIFANSASACKSVMGDRDKLKLAFQNLISNAIKYTKKGGEVHVSLEEAGDGVNIMIRDTGIGISEAGKERLFQKFFRDENAIRTATEGSGLGLYLVKEIIDKHGGTIAVESALNEGTIFRVWLPHIC